MVYCGYIDMGEGNELVAVKTGKSNLSSYIVTCKVQPLATMFFSNL